MGTSTPYGGPNGGTPLVPSWLNGGAGPAGGDEPGNAPPPPPNGSIPPAGDANRFRSARSNYSRFASSGGRDRASLGRAVSSYVASSSGGARQAAQRMGTSRASGARLANFLSTAAAQGPREALRLFKLDHLAGRPIEEVFIGLMEQVCPIGGTIDEGISRDAFVETIDDLAGAGITDFDNMTTEQLQTVFELYTTHTIEARLCNDIATKTIMLPANSQEAASVQKQLHEFILRGVADALAGAKTIVVLTSTQVQGFVDQVYEEAFAILRAMGEAEGDTK